MSESASDVDARHKREWADFRERTKQRRKEARKEGKRRVAEVEASILQEELDMEARHRDEVGAADVEDDNDNTGEEALSRLSVKEVEEVRAREEAEAIERKRAKAQKKRGRKAAKERERAERIGAEASALAKASERTAELEAIKARLVPQGLGIVEIAADGNCLYRAVEHQLGLHGIASPETSHVSLRRRTADYMRHHQDEFIDFLALDADNPERVFLEHCDKVANSTEWGGQPEILALAKILDNPIWVYSRDAPVLKMGDEDSANTPLQLAFHRHYFALGEHYNSVAPLSRVK